MDLTLSSTSNMTFFYLRQTSIGDMQCFFFWKTEDCFSFQTQKSTTKVWPPFVSYEILHPLENYSNFAPASRLIFICFLVKKKVMMITLILSSFRSLCWKAAWIANIYFCFIYQMVQWTYFKIENCYLTLSLL